MWRRQQKPPIPNGVPERLRTQIEWYRDRANGKMYAYLSLKTIQVLVGGAIPVFSVLTDGYILKAGTVVMGSAVTLIETFLQLRQTQADWLRWRSSELALTREAWLFAQKAGPYRNANGAEILLAENVELIIQNELATWLTEQRRSRGKNGEDK